MDKFNKGSYPVFDLFQNQWALVTAGTMDRFNGCTVSWGSLGTVWGGADRNGSTVTVYIHPARYTCEFMKAQSLFTVSFFPPEQRGALAYMGSRSGRYEDKASAAGLTPVPIGGSVGYREAERTFLCRKLYQHQFSKEDLAEDVQAYYRDNPGAYPPDVAGDWQPHWVFIGEILDMKEHN